MVERNSNECGLNGAALRLLSLLAVVILVGCASDESSRDGGRGGPRAERFGPDDPEGGPHPRGALFVSPAGEPFRAGPGDPYPVSVWFAGADADHDGKLTRDEFVADAARFFQRLDANHDGVIDGFEIKAYETEIVPEITEDRAPPVASPEGGGQTFGEAQPGGGQGGGGRRGGGGGRRGGGQGGGQGPGGQSLGGQSLGDGAGRGGGGVQAQGAAPYGLLGEREPVAGSDLDLNSRITLANFKTRAAQRFTRLDADGRGYLLLAELPKTQAQRRTDQRQGRRNSGGPPPTRD